MSLRRGARSLALVPLLAVAMFFSVAAPAANASLTAQPTGGEFVLYVPLSNIQKLGNARIFAGPIQPGYLSFDLVNGGGIHWPVSGGLVQPDTMLGTINSDGGLTMQKWDSAGNVVKKLDITNVKIVDGTTLIGNALGLVPAPAANLINATHSYDPVTGLIHFTADAQIDLVTATVLNTYFDTNVFEAGWILGHVKADIQTKPLL
jgi:hypothetical protein